MAGALALTLRLIYLFGATHNPLFTHLESDPRANDTLGWDIARGLYSEHGDFFRAPLYGYFLAGIYSILGHTLLVPRLLQALMGAGTAMLLGATTSRFWGPRAGVFAAVVAALYGPLIYFDGELVSVSLEIFLTAISIYFTVRAGLDRSTRPLVLAGLALSASAVARPTALPLALVAIAWLLGLRIGARRIALYAAAVALLPLLASAPGASVRKDGVVVASHPHVTEGGPGTAPSSSEAPAWGRGRAKAVARYAKNLALVWNRRELPGEQDQEFVAPLNSWLFRKPWLLEFWFLAPIALVAAFAQRRTATLFAGYLLCTTLVVAAFIVRDRLRLPLVVGLIPLAGVGLDRFMDTLGKVLPRNEGAPAAGPVRIARAHWRTLVALGLAAVAVAAPFPSLQPTESGAGWFRLARAHESAGALNLAGAAYEKAESEGMSTAEFYSSWGSFEMNRRLGVQAGQHLLRAVALDPNHGPAHENLAEIYAERGDWALAAQEYAVAAELVPVRAAELYTSAGTLYARIDRIDTAMEMFGNALAIRPGFAPAAERLADLRAGKRGDVEIPRPTIWSLTPR